MSFHESSPGRRALFLVTVLGLGLGLAGCGGDEAPTGTVDSLMVTGTDGQASDPAQLVPTQNLGQFRVFFDIAGAAHSTSRAEVVIRAPGSGEEVVVYSQCCNDGTSCINQTLGCQYTSGNTVSCGTGGTPTSLTTFFQNNGGLPNTAQLVLRSTTAQCSGSIVSDAAYHVYTASHGIVFR